MIITDTFTIVGIRRHAMMVTMISMMPLHRDWLGYHHNYRHWIWNCLQLKYARARAVIGWNIALDWNFGPNMYFCRILSCLWWSWYDHDGDSESLNWWWPLTRYTDFYNGNCPAGTMCGCEFCTPFIFVIITTITSFLSIMVINFFLSAATSLPPTRLTRKLVLTPRRLTFGPRDITQSL